MQSQHRFTPTLIYLCAGLFSILLSIWYPFKSTLLNPDAICYLESANTIGSQGLHAAMNLCGQAKWPFYSVLIFILSLSTKLSLLQSAFTLDSLFSLISVLTFIYISHLLGGHRRVMIIAAGVILVAHEFNAVRELIIRDHGFWALYLVSVAALIKYLRSPCWTYAITWSISLIIATLFRIEGLFFLLFLPFTALLLPSHKLKTFLQLNTVFLLTVIGAILAYQFSMQHDTGRVADLQFQLSHGIQTVHDRFFAIRTILSQQVLNDYSVHDANIVLVLLFLSWYVVNMVVTLSVLYTLLVIYAFIRRVLVLDKPAKLVLWGYILTNIIVTAAFLIENLFVSKRYLIALSLVLMLWIPFAIDSIVKANPNRKPIFNALFAIIFIAMMIDILHVNDSKLYIKDAGKWLANNTAAQSQIYSNDKQLLYYSGHFDKTIFTHENSHADLRTFQTAKWKAYDYLALRINKKDLNDDAVLKALPLSPIKVFMNKSGDEVLIYRISQQGELL